MLMTITKSDSRVPVWSPDSNRLAYITPQGLHVYLSDENGDHERYVQLAAGDFVEVEWSPTGRYLAAYRADDTVMMFECEYPRTGLIYRTAATTIDWLSDSRLIVVPVRGGLVLVDLDPPVTETPLAG